MELKTAIKHIRNGNGDKVAYLSRDEQIRLHMQYEQSKYREAMAGIWTKLAGGRDVQYRGDAAPQDMSKAEFVQAIAGELRTAQALAHEVAQEEREKADAARQRDKGMHR